MQVIIYKNDNGGVSIIYPYKPVVEEYGIYAIANKDVPANKPYKIYQINELPNDGTFNELGYPNIDQKAISEWQLNEADLTDGVGFAD